MLWAAACMCFFPSDSTFDPSSHLAYEDVWVDNVVTIWYLEVEIKALQMDPFRQGVSV